MKKMHFIIKYRHNMRKCYLLNSKNCLYFTKKIVFVVPKLFLPLAPGIRVHKERVNGDTWPSAFGT